MASVIFTRSYGLVSKKCYPLRMISINHNAHNNDKLRKTIQRGLDTTRKNVGPTNVSPLTLKFCDAYKNSPFSEALVAYNDGFTLENTHPAWYYVRSSQLFSEPWQLLEDFVNGRSVDLPSSEAANFYKAIECLQMFIEEADQSTWGTNSSPNHSLCLKTHVSYESSAQFLLAEHLYSRLVPDRDYILNDIGWREISACCPCEKCSAVKTPVPFALGAQTAWHGHPDILVSSYRLPVHVPETRAVEKELVSLSDMNNTEYSCVEMKRKVGLDHPTVYPQSVAMTIVNSFVMKKYFSLKNFLVPSFISTQDSAAVYFYDCDNDILLRTIGNLNIRDERNDDKLNFETIFFLWLCLNCFIFRPQLMNKEIAWLKQNDRNANFHNLVGDRLGVYQNSLHLELGDCIVVSPDCRLETVTRLKSSFLESVNLRDTVKN